MAIDKYPNFVGRQRQIDLLVQAAKTTDQCNYVLLLDGQGGIGKTALLQQIEKQLKEDHQVFCTRLIDMDDTSYHLPSYFSRTVAEDLGAKAFASYLNALDFYEAEERRHIDLKNMYAHLQKCGYAVTENFNRLAKQKRLTILIDTFEEVQDTELWSFLKQMFVELDNVTFIIAGRRVRELYPKIKELRQKYEFEKSLVVAYAEPFCNFIRQLAHASRRIDKTIFKTLLTFRSEVEADSWWEELQKLPYIRKRASSDYISVHDVLRELIFIYVMPRRDPDRSKRKQINQKLIDCYKTLLSGTMQDLKAREAHFTEEARRQDRLIPRAQPIPVINLAEIVTQSNALERTVWILQAEALHYQLVVDLDEGSRSFIRQFDEATAKRQLTLRERLMHEINSLLADGSIRAGIETYLKISRRLAALEAETGQTEEAVSRVEELLKLYPDPAQQVKLMEQSFADRLDEQLIVRQLAPHKEAISKAA